MHSGVNPTLDFDRDGTCVDRLSVPAAVDRSPYVHVKVAAGDLAGRCHDLERLDSPGEPLHFAEGGTVISHRLHTMSKAGDCLFKVAAPAKA